MKHKYCEKFSALSGNFKTLIMSLSHWYFLSFLKYHHEINKFEVLCVKKGMLNFNEIGKFIFI